MDLTAGQRRLAFLVIVVVLAGLGSYLLITGAGSSVGHQPGRAQASSSAPGQATIGPAGTPPPTSLPATSPPATPGPAASPGAADIYQWLPFSQSDLTKAAATTQQFSAAYSSYSYTENAVGYVATMHGLATSQLSGSLARGYATPGVAGQRAQQKQVSVGTAAITALRAFGPSSLTFLVTIKQAITSKQGHAQRTGQYAVTLGDSGGDWLVNDIEPASAGNL